MPQGDRTGPRGRGPMTGRRMGVCPSYYRRKRKSNRRRRK